VTLFFCVLPLYRELKLRLSTSSLILSSAEGQWTQSSTQDVPDLAAAFDPLQHSKNCKRAQATSISLAGGDSELEVLVHMLADAWFYMQHVA
jgi:hypothetical protein